MLIAGTREAPRSFPGEGGDRGFHPGSRTIFTGNPLHNFHVVAGGVFGWKKAEQRAGSAGDAVHMTFVVAAVESE